MAVVKKDWIFIHIYKTGGNSVRRILGVKDDRFEFGGVHVEAEQVQKKYSVGTTWQNAFKFSFVRNPYDWNASLYYYIRNTNHPLKQYAQGTYLEWLKYLVNTLMHMDKPKLANKYLTQTQFLYKGDDCLVNYYGKFENFDLHMKEICEILDVRYIPLHINKTARRKEWREITGVNEKSIINDVFEKDFINFGYDRE